VADARQKSGIVNLVSVQMQDGQHRTIANGIQEFADVPRSGQRSGFGLAVANHRRDDQLWIVERCAAGMRKHVSQFASFVNRTGSFWRAVAPNAAGEGKLLNELEQTNFVLALFRIYFGVCTLQIPRP
jgi:hypothetical protein